MYGDILDYKFSDSMLPLVNKLTEIEKNIFLERELEQDPLKRIVFAKVNFALVAACKSLHWESRIFDFSNPP